MKIPAPGATTVFGPVILAYVVASWCLAALTWDGAGYVFTTLQEGSPVISHQRFSNWPTLSAVAAAGAITGNARAIGMLYGLLVSITPVGALALSFHFLRKPPLDALRVWWTLGILWTALPGEICLMSEASLAMQVFWPLLAFVAAGMPARGGAWILPVAAYLFFLHPTAALMFGIVALFCFAMTWGGGSRAGILWGILFALLAVLRIAFSMATITTYERSEFGFRPNWDAFLGAIWGWPIGLLVFLYLFGIAWLFMSTRHGGRGATRWALGAAAGFLVVGLWWASGTTRWAGAISYRRFALLCTLPLVAMATAHWLMIFRRPNLARSAPSWAPALVAILFSAIYTVQCLSWRSDVIRFAQALEASPSPFLTLADQPWMKHRALDHWGSSMLSAILQGRKPRVLYAESPSHIKDGEIELFPGGWLRMTDRWFLLSHRVESESEH